MKRVFLYSFILLLSIISCKKNDAPKVIEDNVNDEKPVVYNQSTISEDALGWLKFEDRNNIMAALQDLELSNEQYEDHYVNCLASYNDDMTDSQVDSLYNNCGYVENKPLLDFEELFTGFISLREDLESKREQWQITHQYDAQLDFSSYPEHHCDGYVASVFNYFGEVQVGNLVYFYKKDGRFVAVKREDLDASNIVLFRELFYDDNFDVSNYSSTVVTNQVLIDSFLYGEQPSVKRKSNEKMGVVLTGAVIVATAIVIQIIYDLDVWLGDNNTVHPNCSYDDNEGEDYSLGSNKKLHSYSKWREFAVLGQQSYAYIEYQILKSGKWKKRRHEMGLYIYSPVLVRDLDCSLPYSDIVYTPLMNYHFIKKRRKVHKGKWADGGFHGTKIHKNERHSYFYNGSTQVMDYYNNW